VVGERGVGGRVKRIDDSSGRVYWAEIPWTPYYYGGQNCNLEGKTKGEVGNAREVTLSRLLEVDVSPPHFVSSIVRLTHKHAPLPYLVKDRSRIRSLVVLLVPVFREQVLVSYPYIPTLPLLR